jgi:uncharacterized protein (TIGR02145 family)
MKRGNILRTISFLAGIYACIGSGDVSAQNIGVNSVGTMPNPKALLDIDVSASGTKMGLLIPRMTTAERNSITAPIPESLLLYNTTTQCFEAWNQSATVWVPFGCIGCTAAPVAPSANAALGVSTTSLTAYWTSVAGATVYLLDVSTSSTFATFVSGYNGLNVGNTLTGAVNSLTCGATYYYRVRATNACGTSVSSNTITVATPACCTTPGAPMANAATGIGTTSFTANWNTVAGATDYLLDVSTSSTFSGFVSGYNGVSVGNVLSSAVSSLTCGTTYYYRLRATNACGTSISSNTITVVTTSCCTAPSAPLANAATGIGTASFTANWNTVAGATDYLLDVSTSSAFAGFVSGYNGVNVGNVLTASVSSLTCATTYYYRVRAMNACGTSASSNTITIVTAACPVVTPTITACGTQVWAALNMNTGTMITTGATPTNNSIVEKYCYNDIPANCTTYGGLYQWDEMMNYAPSATCDPCGSSGVQGICPAGFHVPTDLEWSRYEFCLESTVAPTGTVSLSDFQTLTAYRGTTTGSKLKVTAGNTPAWDGTNTSGFSALPAGYYTAGGAFFSNIGMNINFWTATDQGTNGWYRRLGNGVLQSGRFAPSGDKSSGFSVRCLQD